MWKRSEPEAPSSITMAPISTLPSSSPVLETKVKATIGPEICVKGTISGAEDLMVLGTVEGKIELSKNIVTVGRSGRVKANISGKTVHVEGEVEGDLVGTEQVIVHKAGQVIGNINAPRVALEDGARVKGTIDTDSPSGESELSATKIEDKSQVKAAVASTIGAVESARAALVGKPEARV